MDPPDHPVVQDMRKHPPGHPEVPVVDHMVCDCPGLTPSSQCAGRTAGGHPGQPLVLQRRVVLQGNSWADFETGNERVRVSHDERSVAEEEDLSVFSQPLGTCRLRHFAPHL